jgi:hypothetical protein
VPIPRIAALIVALSAWFGVALQFLDFFEDRGNRLIAALWEMVMYLTIVTNLLVAVAFSAIALGHPVAPWIVGCMMQTIVLVAVIYALLLRDLPLGPLPTAALSNTMVHRVTPALVTLFWIVFVPRGSLVWSDAWRWVAYPFGYTCYALVRGAVTGRYPYAFLDAAQIGWPATIRNAALIAVAFVAVSFLLIEIDRLVGHSA